MQTFEGIFLSSFLIALSGAFMPGPLLTVTIGESPRQGPRFGPLLILGHGLLELALVFLLLIGLGGLLQRPMVLGMIGLIGGGILWWMAYGMVRSLPGLSLQEQGTGSAKKVNPLWSGVLLSLSNPYWLIWWATIGLGYILFAYRYGLWGIVSFFTGHILADFSWYTLISFSMAKGRRFLKDFTYRLLIGSCALILFLFGIYFGWSGIRQLLW